MRWTQDSFWATAGALAGLIAAPAVQAQTTTVLYNGTAGGTPASQGFLLFGSAGSSTETYNAAGQYTAVDTTQSAGNYAGYSSHNVTVAPSGTSPFFTLTPTTPVNPAFPVLNRAAGYMVNFTVQIPTQPVSSANRAGFSLIALGSDKQGVEIGFHLGDLFALDSSFNVTETTTGNAALTPTQIQGFTSALTAYSLNVQGSSYTLRTGNTTLLSGALKDYTGATGFAGDVYRTSNFLFLGDDTTSASGTFNLARASVVTGTAAPEPATLAFFLPTVLCFAGRLSTLRGRAGFLYNTAS